jgi:2',3'-cyclic-nucleotide 2'-phosphodiesterase (5'-nucleotidase family)
MNTSTECRRTPDGGPAGSLLQRLFTPSRRRFLSAAGSAAASTTLARTAAAAIPEESGGRARTVSIFHTTDLHGHVLPTQTYEGLRDVGGLARCASCIRQWRAESPHSLTLDVGDVVQGTAASLERRGLMMIDLFNLLGYDAWTLGNHDFDWGPEALEAILDRSESPVVTANLLRGGRPPGGFDGAWGKVRPWILREVGGFRIAILGLVTPGLTWWLSDETLGGVAATDPVETLARSIAEAKAERADAIVVTGHMGWKFKDDYANPLRELLRDAGDVDIYLAGHSHQNQPAFRLHDTLCSQASYHGIHCGRIDLTFDGESRRLVDTRAFTLLMDDRFPLDPAVLQVARPDIAASEEALAREVCVVGRPIPGGGKRQSGVVTLLCEAFSAVLAKRGTPVDGVFHGSFGTKEIPAGTMSVADCWRLVPYENTIVTAELSAEDLVRVVAEDAEDRRSDRSLWPFTLELGKGNTPERFLHRGRPVQPDERFRIAFNSYDAQSGGRRLLLLRELLARPEAKRSVTPLDTRTALIDFLLDRRAIG